MRIVCHYIQFGLALAVAVLVCPESFAVYGGQPVDRGSPLAHSVVALLHDEGSDLNVEPCTAIVIAPRVLLTAAHCVKSPLWRIRAVETVNFYNDFKRGRLRPYEIPREQIFVHPDYLNPQKSEAERSAADLALLVLKSPMGNANRPLPLDLNPPASEVPREIIALGYGEDLRGRDSGLLQWASLDPAAQDSAVFLAVDQTRGKGLCSGDSGGPALVQGADGQVSVIGVAAFVTAPMGQPPCTSKGVFVRLWRHRDWITHVTESL